MKQEIEKILVVDDEQVVCNMLTKFLRSSGYCCDAVTCPVEALEILTVGGFDLVISDIRMSGIDGMQLLSRILELPAQIDTIMMSALIETYTYSDIIRAGAADFIAKPFQLAEIKAKIERINRERKMQKELQELNVTMAVLLRRAEKQKDDLSRDIALNMKKSVLPYLDILKKSRFD